VTSDQERQLAGLMHLAQRGDREAYGELLASLTSVARRFVRGRVGDVSWTEDVVQEVLITVHRARHTYDPARAFAPWFYAIASNRLIDVIRRERRIAGREHGMDTLPEPVAATTPTRQGDIDVVSIRRAVASLPERQRDVIEGMKFRDESVREVSSRLGISEAAVKITAHRGYKALRRLLGGSADADR
jgi:RNA polymerase sigma-70 factor (ECF subfamily)